MKLPAVKPVITIMKIDL